MVGVLARTAI
ncbi:hypothetical protein VCHENC02_1028A, partial [Vibrio harveyi]